MSSIAPEPDVTARDGRALPGALLAGVTASTLVTAATFLPRANTLTSVDGQGVTLAAAACWLVTLVAAARGRRHSAPVPRSVLVRVLLGAAALWTVLALAGLAMPAGSGLAGQYFRDTSFNGPPALTVVDRVPSDRQVQARWRDAPPAAFSVAWTGYLTAARNGRYRFATLSDDGSRLYIDDQLVVDNGGTHGPRMAGGEVDLTAGPHRVVLQYTQEAGGIALQWRWTPAGDFDEDPVPGWALSRRRVSPTEASVARTVGATGRLLALVVVLAGAWIAAFHGVPRVAAMGRPAWRVAASGFRSQTALAFSLLAWSAVLFLPRPEGGLLRAAAGTTRELHDATFRSLHHLETFRANLDIPRAGEQQALPGVALEVMAMLDRHGLATYRLSESLSSNDWVLQQIVASAWPRRFEPAASALFVGNGDAVDARCRMVEQGREVSLVSCS